MSVKKRPHVMTKELSLAGQTERFRCLFAYTEVVSVGFSESERRPILTPERYVATVAIAASIIASVRLAKVADLDLNISKVVTTVQQSVRLARTILDEALR